jgi:hypothetical protein
MSYYLASTHLVETKSGHGMVQWPRNDLDSVSTTQAWLATCTITTSNFDIPVPVRVTFQHRKMPDYQRRLLWIFDRSQTKPPLLWSSNKVGLIKSSSSCRNQAAWSPADLENKSRIEP